MATWSKIKRTVCAESWVILQKNPPPLTDIMVVFTAHTIVANRYSTTSSVPLLAFPTPIILSEQLYLTRGVNANGRSQHFQRFQMQWEMMRVERGRGMGPLPSYGAKTRRGRDAPGYVHGRFCGFFMECERLTTTDALLSSLPKKINRKQNCYCLRGFLR